MASASKTPKADALRDMRERRHEERQKRLRAKPEPKAVKVAKVKALASAVSNAALSNKTPAATQSNAESAALDKAAYQREYMRKRRAAAKAT